MLFAQIASFRRIFQKLRHLQFIDFYNLMDRSQLLGHRFGIFQVAERMKHRMKGNRRYSGSMFFRCLRQKDVYKRQAGRGTAD